MDSFGRDRCFLSQADQVFLPGLGNSMSCHVTWHEDQLNKPMGVCHNLKNTSIYSCAEQSVEGQQGGSFRLNLVGEF